MMKKNYFQFFEKLSAVHIFFLLLISGYLWLIPIFLYGAPQAITDLVVKSAGFRHIVLQWTAPYDAGASATPAYYEIRVSSYRVIVDENDWNNNSTSTSYPYRIKFSTITTAGILEIKTVSSLVNNQTYFFAIKSSTDDINWSSLDTTSPEPQSSPFNSNPGNVSGYNYTGTPTAVVFTQTPLLTWNAVTNAGNAGTDNIYGDSIESYTLWYSTLSNFSTKFVADNITNTYYTPLPLAENTTYYWRVYAVDSEGLLSPGVVGVPQFVVNAASEPPPAPSLIQPINDAIETGSSQPSFWWGSVKDPDPADYVVYDFYISTSILFETSITTTATGLTNTFWSPYWELSENYRYYWKVYARDSTGLGTTSSTTSVRINVTPEDPGAFDTFYPKNGIKVFTSSPTLSWLPSVDPDPGDSVVYDLKYSSSDPTLSDFPQALSIDATFYKVNGLWEDTLYWWRVIARDSTNRTTLSVSISSFIVNEYNYPPSSFSLIYSSGILRTINPVFIWSASTDQDGDNVFYQIKISSYPDFAFYISSSGLTNTSYIHPAPFFEENFTYYWQVSAYDDIGLKRFSATWYFVINAIDENPSTPVVLYPNNGEVVSTLQPQLRWQSSYDPDPYDFVDHYVLEYSTNESLSPSSTLILGTTYYIFNSPLSNNTTYWWHIVAVSTLTGTAASIKSKFITGNLPPSDFALINPINNSIIKTSTPTFMWQVSSDPQGEKVYYDLYFSTDSLFAVYFSSLNIATTYYVRMTPLSENKTYYWKVISRNETGSYRTASGSPGSFSVNVIEESPSAFNLLQPSPVTNAVVGTLTPEFKWENSYDPDPGDSVVYELWYSRADPNFSSTENIVIISSVPGTIYSITADAALQPDTTYYWRVYANDTTGHSVKSLSDGKFYVSPSVRPLPPSELDLVFREEEKSAALSWKAPTLNDDGSPLSGISYYAVYIAYDYDALFETSPSTYVAGSFTGCTLSPVYPGAYVGIKSINNSGVKSIMSNVIRADSDNTVTIIFRDQTGNIIIESDKNIFRSTSSLSIVEENLPSDDSKTVYSFRVVGTSTGAFSSSLTLKVRLSFLNSDSPSFVKKSLPTTAQNSLAIYWFNGVEWVSLGGKSDNQRYITAQITSGGRYRLRSVSRSETFRIMNVWPRVFTPNGDGVNDEFNITFDNPYSQNVEGWIYDLSGYRIGKMTIKTDSWIFWDGRDENGKIVPTGVYIYQIKSDDITRNGTVVVAR